MIFSIHIPKTAGTSFRKALEERYGDRLALYYGAADAKTHPLLRVGRGQLLSRLPALADRGVEVLHGHYRVSHVKPAVTDPGRQLWTWLRDPIDRVASHYYFYRERPVTAALGEEVRAGGLSLEAFAEDRMMRNLQARYLQGGSLAEFGFVGLTERFELGLAMLFGEGAPRLPMRYNATQGKKDVPVEARALIGSLNARDITLYAQGVRLVEARAATLGEIDVPETPGASKPGLFARVLGRVA